MVIRASTVASKQVIEVIGPRGGCPGAVALDRAEWVQRGRGPAARPSALVSAAENRALSYPACGVLRI